MSVSSATAAPQVQASPQRESEVQQPLPVKPFCTKVSETLVHTWTFSVQKLTDLKDAVVDLARRAYNYVCSFFGSKKEAKKEDQPQAATEAPKQTPAAAEPSVAVIAQERSVASAPTQVTSEDTEDVPPPPPPVVDELPPPPPPLEPEAAPESAPAAVVTAPAAPATDAVPQAAATESAPVSATAPEAPTATEAATQAPQGNPATAAAEPKDEPVQVGLFKIWPGYWGSGYTW